MSKLDTVQRELCRKLGDEYRIMRIDYEKVIYRDFGNGFNVEISGTHTTSEKKRATIYLWYGDRIDSCLIVRKVKDVAREDIHEVVEELLEYSNELLEKGYGSRDKIFSYLYKVSNCANGGGNMRYKFYFGNEKKLTAADKQMFNHGNYTCRELFQTSTGMPVAILKHNDPEFPVWKIVHGFSCMVFGSYDLALEYCKGKFRTLDGKVV